MDYERGVMRLTGEQEEAVSAARPGRDCLIRGGAGTGKTIVLLHAFGAAVRDRAAELALHPGSRILFFTYTRTLVKYDRYVADILRETEGGGAILTVDSFFQDRLRLRGRQQKIDYAVIGQLAARLNTTGFFSPPELALEIEDFIFANNVTRKEYIEERIPRRGMRTPLFAGQREAVWKARDRMVEAMEHDGILSRNYSRCALIDHLSSSADSPLRDLDAAFVDESQDLTAADLGALKLMSRRGLIMAGDTGQSIYGVSSPYKRAGVDIAGPHPGAAYQFPQHGADPGGCRRLPGAVRPGGRRGRGSPLFPRWARPRAVHGGDPHGAPPPPAEEDRVVHRFTRLRS